MIGTPIGVQYYAAPSGGGTMDVRLRDTTNNNTVSEKTGITSLGLHTDLSTSNWPAGQAVIELQMKVSQEGETAYISDAIIGFA